MASKPQTTWLLVPWERDRSAWIVQSENDRILSRFLEASETMPLAQVVVNDFYEHGYPEGEPILCGLRSGDVLAVSLPAESDVKESRESSLYELEEYVPLAAEQMTADVLKQKEHRLAVVVENEGLERLLDGLDTAGLLIANLVPLAALACQHFSEQWKENQAVIVLGKPGVDFLFQEGKRDIFYLSEEGKPFRWYLLDDDPAILAQTLATEPPLPQVEPPDDSDSLLRSVMRQVAAILEGKQKPWWDLRHGALVVKSGHRLLRRSIQTVLWGGVILLAAVCFSCGYFWVRYHSIAEAHHQKQREMFTEALPAQKLETGFRNRLESESRKMSALRENLSNFPDRVSVLVPLFHLLESLPKETRYRFPEIRIERNRVRLNGRLQTHSDAEVIASRLQQGGFQVEPPATQQDHEQGVTVRLSLQWNSRGGEKGGQKP